jgi:ATP adenylyltransferase
MERLFSPWRSAYIRTFADEKKGKVCLFCTISKARKDDRNHIVWRGKYCFVVMNRYPYNNGHLMIVPYRHTARFAELADDENREIMNITGKCISALQKVSNPQGFNFGANLGRVAGAGIDKHIHFHLVPRWNGDSNFMPVIANTKVVSEEINKTFRKLKKILSDRN